MRCSRRRILPRSRSRLQAQASRSEITLPSSEPVVRRPMPPPYEIISLHSSMSRRFLVALFRRSIAVFVLICLGCSAQLAPDVNQRIERQVRSTYNLPPDVKVSISTPKASEFPNYDQITVTLNNAEKKQDVNFLLSKDGKTLVRFSKMDLSKDPYAEIMKKIDTAGRPTRGNKDAKVVVVNYDDFECPFCSRMHNELFPTMYNE